MELAPRECGLLDADVAPFAAIAGDRRTGRLLGDVIHGIIGGESPVCAQIAAVSPPAGRGPLSRAADPPLNVLGIGTGGRRGLLYRKLSSSAAADLPSEPAAVRAAIRPVGAALAPRGADPTAIDGSGFGDRAIRGGPRDRGMRLVCRLKRRDRLVRPASDRPVCHLGEPAPRPKVPAHIGAEPVVRKTGQPRPKRQPATAAVSSVPVRVPSRRRTGDRGEVERERACWLAEVRPERVEAEPRWLLTDRPVETAAQATAVFRTYCRRWAIEGAFEIAKQCPGWEDVQVLADEAMRLPVAVGWAAAGFLSELGVALGWPEARVLRRPGGGADRDDRPPGQQVPTRGRRRPVDPPATEAILADEARRHGCLPPRIAALLGRPAVP